VAGGEPLQRHVADGGGEVNLNLRSMLGPRARPHLRPQAWEPVLAEEGAHRALGRLDVGAPAEGGEQLALGLFGVLLGPVARVPLADALAVRALAEVEHDGVGRAAADDGALAAHCCSSS
jgi:hypothetical protein